MKIGIIVDALDDGAAGIGVYAKNLVKNILLIDKNNQYFLIHYKRNDFCSHLKVRDIIIPVKNIPFYKEFRKIFLIPILLRKYKLDIVHELTQIGPFFLPAKFKKIVTIHDLTALKFSDKHLKIDYYRHKLGLPVILRKVDRIITDSYSTKKDLIDFFPKLNLNNKTTVIHLGTSFSLYNAAKNNQNALTLNKYNISKPFILYVGTIEPRKNLEMLLDLLALLKQKKYNYKLVIVGKWGWKYDNYIAKLKNLKLQNDVIFTNFISEQDKINLYKQAELMIYPSFYEGFGLPVLEAMANECPVISSNTSSLPEIAFSPEILFNPNNVEEIFAKTKKIISDSEYRNLLIERGLSHAQKFSWKKTAEKTLDCYNKLHQ